MPSDNASSLQIIKMCENLELLGNKIHLILPKTGFKQPIKKFYNLNKTLRIIRCKNFTKFPIGLNYYYYSLLSILKSLRLNVDFYYTRNFFCAFLLNLMGKKIIFELHHSLEMEGRIIRFKVLTLSA